MRRWCRRRVVETGAAIEQVVLAGASGLAQYWCDGAHSWGLVAHFGHAAGKHGDRRHRARSLSQKHGNTDDPDQGQPTAPSAKRHRTSLAFLRLRLAMVR